MAERKWRVLLGAAAELDFANILKWTTENFGRGSPVSIATLVQAIGELMPTVPMSLDPKPETRSCGASAFCTLRDMVVADVTF
jgi:hypothetical protein